MALASALFAYIYIIIHLTYHLFDMSTDAVKKQRTTKHRAHHSIQLNRSIIRIKWDKVLEAYSKKHRVSNPVPAIVDTTVAIVVDQPDSVTGTPSNRTPVQLRRLLSNIRFDGITGPIQGRIDHTIRAYRQFLTNATNQEIAGWWRRLHRQLPEPCFFLVYAALKATL